MEMLYSSFKDFLVSSAVILGATCGARPRVSAQNHINNAAPLPPIGLLENDDNFKTLESATVARPKSARHFKSN